METREESYVRERKEAKRDKRTHAAPLTRCSCLPHVPRMRTTGKAVQFHVAVLLFVLLFVSPILASTTTKRDPTVNQANQVNPVLPPSSFSQGSASKTQNNPPTLHEPLAFPHLLQKGFPPLPDPSHVTQVLSLSLAGSTVLVIAGGQTPVVIENNRVSVLENQEQRVLGALQPSAWDQVLLVNAPFAVIEDTVFEGTGLLIENSPNVTVRNNVFRNIDMEGESYGVKVVDSPFALIEGNVFDNIVGEQDKGGVLTTPVGLELRNSGFSTIKNNTLQNIHSTKIAAYGMFLVRSERLRVEDNVVQDLRTLKFEINGITLRRANDSVVAGNRVVNFFKQKSGFTIRGVDVGLSRNITVKGNVIGNFTANQGFLESPTYGVVFGLKTEDPLLVEGNVFFNLDQPVYSDWDEPTCRNNTFNGQVYDGCQAPLVTKTWDIFTPMGWQGWLLGLAWTEVMLRRRTRSARRSTTHR